MYMNFNFYLLKSLRILLFPLALLYAIIVKVRNFLFDKNILKSAQFNLPIICVGNLVVGGTGKSPMVELLVDLLRYDYHVATLSRGYKRRTKGYVLANENTTAIDIGDEPMQFHLKFPEVPVAVGEERVVAVPQILFDKPETEVIILDDAFQHRSIHAGFNIVLTEYNNIYTHDFYLPTGDLRDDKNSAHRANVIVVTKCPPNLHSTAKQVFSKTLRIQAHQKLYFTTIEYGMPYHIIHRDKKMPITEALEVLMVCGIANPTPLKQFLTQHAKTYHQQSYNDHRIFTIDDLKDIQTKFNAITSTQKIILTTEKDAVRMLKFKEKLNDMPMYIIPIRHYFLFDEEPIFTAQIKDFVDNFNPTFIN